jgi:hypothetical protein
VLLSVPQVRIGTFPSATPVVLASLLTVSDNKNDATKAAVAGLFQSLVPLLPVERIKNDVMTALRGLAADASPVVVRTAIRAITSLYEKSAEPSVLALVKRELDGLLERGPKAVSVAALRVARATPCVMTDAGLWSLCEQVIVDVVVGLTRVVPRTEVGTRDNYVLVHVRSARYDVP